MRFLKYTLLAVVFTLCTVSAFAQYSFQKGKSTFEIEGVVAGFYNHRFYPDGATNEKKNRFKLRNARLRLDARLYPHWTLKLNMDFSGMAGTFDWNSSDNSTIIDASIKYDSPWNFDVTAGFQRVPFSRNSMTTIFDQAFLNRPTIADGSLFFRRDLGVTLHTRLWEERINIYAGAYNGHGALFPDNDASGNLMYAARADFSWPSRFRYNEIDRVHVPIPMFSVGGSAIYADKKLLTGELGADPGDGYIRNPVGKNLHLGADFAFQWKGFSAQAEWYRGRHDLSNAADPLLNGKPTNYVQSGGWFVGGNYYIKPLKVLVAAKYDEVNINDLVDDDTQQTVWFGVNYLINGTKTMIRSEYRHNLDAARSGKDEMRLGFQQTF